MALSLGYTLTILGLPLLSQEQHARRSQEVVAAWEKAAEAAQTQKLVEAIGARSSRTAAAGTSAEERMQWLLERVRARSS